MISCGGLFRIVEGGSMDEQKKMMKRAGMRISLCMGITLSFFLSILGVLSSGNFSIPAWVISFIISTVISLIIGFIVPMKRVSDSACAKLGLKPGKLSTRCFEALLSDLIYTPVITFCMVFLAYKAACSDGAAFQFLPMFLHSLLISMIAGFVLIFIFMPFYMKLILGQRASGNDRS